MMDCPKCDAEDSMKWDAGVWVCDCCGHEVEADRD